MARVAIQPVFVCRQTAAAMIEISVDTFDTWLRAGFTPSAQIERGQIIRRHWPTLEQHLAGDSPPKHHDPFLEGLKNVQKGRRHAAA